MMIVACLALYLFCEREDGHRQWLTRLRRLSHRGLVAMLAAGALAGGVFFATTVAGGADAYGYVSQAELWQRGKLTVEQPWVADLPWPSRNWSASPLGYRPMDAAVTPTLVPIYSPGLPLLMAGAKFVAGQEGLFWAGHRPSVRYW